MLQEKIIDGNIDFETGLDEVRKVLRERSVYGTDMLRIFGLDYAAVNIISKALRLLNLLKDYPRNDRAIKDTVLDAAGYAIIFLSVLAAMEEGDDANILSGTGR